MTITNLATPCFPLRLPAITVCTTCLKMWQCQTGHCAGRVTKKKMRLKIGLKLQLRHRTLSSFNFTVLQIIFDVKGKETILKT